jgi:hypothetical protein
MTCVVALRLETSAARAQELIDALRGMARDLDPGSVVSSSALPSTALMGTLV